MRLPRDESGGRCSLGQNSATEGPVCQIGLAGSWLPQAKTTWGRAPCPSDRAQLDFRGELPVPGAEAPPPGGRGRPPLRGRADPARLSIPLHDRGIRQIGVTRPEQTKAVKRTSVPKTQKSLANCQQRGGCSASRFGKLAAASAEPWGPLLPVLAREEFAHIRFHLAVIGMNGGTQGGFR